jgi:hypothetical protein
MARRIVSIASASGWSARIEQEMDNDRLVTLAAWALVDDGKTTELVGLVQAPTSEGAPGRFMLADEVDAFAGYKFAGVRTRVEPD